MAKKIELSGAAFRTLTAHLDVLSATEGDVESVSIEDAGGKDKDATHVAEVTFSGGTTMSLCHRRLCPWVECDPGG